MDTGFDTSKIAYGNRPFIHQPPPFAVQMIPIFGATFIIAGLIGVATAFYCAYAFGVSQFLLIGGLSYGMMFLGTVTIAFYHLVAAMLDNRQMMAYRGKGG